MTYEDFERKVYRSLGPETASVLRGQEACFTADPAVLPFVVRGAREIESEAAEGKHAAAPFGDTGGDSSAGEEKRPSWQLNPSVEHLAFFYRDTTVAHYFQRSALNRSRAVRRLLETSDNAHSPADVLYSYKDRDITKTH